MILRITLFLILVVIAYLSLTPKETLTIGNDKISHFIAYAILMVNIGLIVYGKIKGMIIGVSLALIYGALMEVGQHFVPGRFMSIMDILANSLGVLFGVIVTLVFGKYIIQLLHLARINP